jgi:hypothetical protein
VIFAALAALAFQAAAVEAPVEAATVFSSGARLTRTAHVTLDGTTAVELPLLPDTIDPASIRIEAEGAEVKRADISRVDQAALPVGEARSLLDALDALDDRLAQVRGEAEARSAMVHLVGQLRPQLPSELAGLARPRLDPSPWRAGHDFVNTWLQRLQAQVRDDQQKVETLERERTPLLEKIGALQAERHGGFRVIATVSGHGTATVHLLYFTPSASWLPSYDLQLEPASGTVRVSLSGEVSQQTGESWRDVALTLSTAQARQETELPRLTRWVIGERERFIPTPVAAPAPVAPPPPAPPLPPRALDESTRLDRRLARVGAQPSSTPMEKTPVGEEDQDKSDRPTPRPSPPQRYRSEPPKGGMAPMAPSPQPASALSAPSAAPQREFESDALQSAPVEVSSFKKQEMATQGVGLAPPPGVELALAPGSPAALAQGNDLTFAALRKESVESGGGSRRVPLLSTSWKVAAQRQLFPALAPEAFLTAELESPERTILPGGEARLFVGADPAGLAQLQMMAPGEKFSLPLGVDRALTPLRTVKLAQVEKGLIAKDEVTDYTVTIELANPYPSPTAVRIFDQWPPSREQHVEVQLLETKPYAAQDAATGKLEWRTTLPAHAASTFTFRYRIRRPKGYRLTP